MNRCHNKKRFYVRVHNTVSTTYAGDIRLTIMCNLTDEAKETVKDAGDKFYVKEAVGFVSCTLLNTRPTPLFCITGLTLGEWDENYERQSNQETNSIDL